MRKNRALLYGASVCALWASCAAAQEPPPPAPASAAATQQASSAPQAAQSAQSSGNSLAEIVVTAQRREQKLQDVPITISAIGGPALASAGVTGTSQLQATVPNLVINRAIGAATPFLRGIGFYSGDVNAEGSVAMYVDGVYQPSSYANLFDFNNIERIEVLKGPQGTLFGRNATGGVVQVITKAPSSQPQADFSVGYANYATVKASAYASGGLTENLAGSLAVQYQNQADGWGRNLTTGSKAYLGEDLNIRGKLLYRPSDATSLTLSANYSDFNRQNQTGQPIPGSHTVVTGEGYPGGYNVVADLNGAFVGKSYGGSATLTHDFGGFQINSITAYQKGEGTQTLDQDMSSLALVDLHFTQRTQMTSEEFHVLSPSDAKFQWLVGAYFFDYQTGFVPVHIYGAFLPPPGVDNYGEAHTQSIAVFGQGTYPLAEKTDLTVGLRYSEDTSRYTGVSYVGPVVVDPLLHKDYKNGKPTWRISLDHKFTPDVMGYISYNRGIKAGGFSVSTTPSFISPFLPEQLDAYEAGLKTRLFERSVLFNVAAFYYDFKNMQFQRTLNGGVVQVLNGPSATVYGLEAELNGRVTDHLTLTANASYLHSRIGDFPGAPNTCRLPSGTDDTGGVFCNTLGTPKPVPFNAKGDKLPNSPEFSGKVGFEYQVPIQIGRVKLSSNLLYASKAYTELDNRLVVPEHVLLNASLGWEGDNGVRVSIWGNNLTNKFYYAQMTGIGGLSDFGIPAAPRTYGITIGYSFR